MAYDTYNTLIVNMLVWRISLWNCSMQKVGILSWSCCRKLW